MNNNTPFNETYEQHRMNNYLRMATHDCPKEFNDCDGCPQFTTGRCYVDGSLELKLRSKDSPTARLLKWILEHPEAPVDWRFVPVDTKVLVSTDGVTWKRGYFAKVDSDGVIYTYSNGTTSWSISEFRNEHILPWKYAKLFRTD